MRYAKLLIGIDHTNQGRQGDNNTEKQQDPILQLLPDIDQADGKGKGQQRDPEDQHLQTFLSVSRKKGADDMEAIKKDHQGDLFSFPEEVFLFSGAVVEKAI